MQYKIENFYIMYPTLIKYPMIIKTLQANETDDGLCYITQKSIGEVVGLSPSAISKYMRRLIKFDRCIEIIKPGVYKILHSNMFTYGPVSKVLLYHIMIEKDSDFATEPFSLQKSILGFDSDTMIFVKQHLATSIGEIMLFNDPATEEELMKRFANYCNRYKVAESRKKG